MFLIIWYYFFIANGCNIISPALSLAANNVKYDGNWYIYFLFFNINIGLTDPCLRIGRKIIYLWC